MAMTKRYNSGDHDVPTGEQDDRLPLTGDQHQHVVIIDDQATGRTILERVVQNISPNITQSSYADPHEALRACRKRPPDLLITDYRMPILNGIEVIREFRKIPGCTETPIVVVTIVEDKNIRYEALEAGATDFLNRPFDHYECQARCRNLLLLHKYQQEATHRARNLELQIAFATQQIKRREHETLFCLAKAGEFRDEGTGNHIERMAHYSVVIARALGLPDHTLDELEYASPMHDIGKIGKIGIPDAILLKPGKLTTEEWEVMKQHTIIGYDILAKSTSPYLQMVAIADTLDALTTVRPYKAPWPLEKSFEYIRKNAGKHFDPACVEAFFSEREKIEEIYSNCSDLNGKECGFPEVGGES